MDLIAKCRKKRCINTRLLFLLLSAVALIRAYYFSGHLQDSTTTKRTHLDFHGPMIDIRGSSSSSSSSSSSKHHRLSSRLSCERYGGPSAQHAAEMVYWNDIPSDDFGVSRYRNKNKQEQFLSFEPFKGGWNNNRMLLETVVALAYAFGRTVVLPPAQSVQRLGKNTFSNYFHLDALKNKYLASTGVDIITTEEFLKREALTGHLRNKDSRSISFPPGNRTQWDKSRWIRKLFIPWIRSVATTPIWNFQKCIFAFPSDPSDALGKERLNATLWDLVSSRLSSSNSASEQSPPPVDAPPQQRLAAMMAGRQRWCWYDQDMQQARVIHLPGEFAALIVNFYAFLFFEDWKQDLWTKRLIRDQLRYADEIQCAAARVVQAMRKHSQQQQHDGIFDSLHVRRGDFEIVELTTPQYLYDNSRDVLEPRTTIYIATDERNKTFFDIFRKDYHVYFLDDFMHLLEHVDSKLYGMIDQRVASKGRTFVGTYASTFTGYIMRLRGYHSQLERTPGYETGVLNNSYYFNPAFKNVYREYQPIAATAPLWTREHALGWRDLDHEVDADGSLE